VVSTLEGDFRVNKGAAPVDIPYNGRYRLLTLKRSQNEKEFCLLLA
jgi:hypothetical protein